MGDGGRGEGAAGGLYRTGEEAGGLGLEERRESEDLRIIHQLPSGKILRDGENRKRGSWNAYDKAGGGLLGLKETNNNGAVGRWEREVGELPPPPGRTKHLQRCPNETQCFVFLVHFFFKHKVD